MKYRRLYEKTLGVVLSKDFDVHHIDGDRSNNEIGNLVALPKKLHNEYHRVKFFGELNQNLPQGCCGFSEIDYFKDRFEAFYPIYKECQKWVLYKNHILYGVPNVYGLSY